MILGLLLGKREKQWLSAGIVIGMSLTSLLLSTFSSTTSSPRVENSNELAESMKKQVRVLCWVLTQPNNHKTVAVHVQRTWGRRCNKLLFMSSEEDKELGIIGLKNVSEGRDWLWAKTRGAFKYVWENHRDEADWFLKADDDTYVVVENLRNLLKDYPTSSPLLFGCAFNQTGSGYPASLSGGAGYVLSKEALRIFVEVSLQDPEKCRPDHEGAEDAELVKCMEHAGVPLGDSRDALQRHRFMVFPPQDHLYPDWKDMNYWYWQILMYPQDQGMNCCSNTAISFHYIEPRMMYVLEYLIYHLKPVGINKEILYVQDFTLETTTSTTTTPSTPPTPPPVDITSTTLTPETTAAVAATPALKVAASTDSVKDVKVAVPAESATSSKVAAPTDSAKDVKVAVPAESATSSKVAAPTDSAKDVKVAVPAESATSSKVAAAPIKIATIVPVAEKIALGNGTAT